MNATNQKMANDPVQSLSRIDFASELRVFARQYLAEAVVPAKFIVMESLPKLPNGKVDRTKLPKVELNDSYSKKYIPPTLAEEIRIVAIWSDLLGITHIGIEDSFFDIGGDSISAVQMITKVREEFGFVISVRNFFKNPTVIQLAKMLGAKTQSFIPTPLLSLDDSALMQEAELPDDIIPDKDAIAAATTPYQSILLTGGTGYTGAFILRELLDSSKALVYVLVRAQDALDAIERIRDNMVSHQLWLEGDEKRLKGIAGDIGRPYFGLTKSIYHELSTQIEMIIHNAALSSYAMPYWQLKPINVLGTQEVLRLACRKRIKPVHYISSLAVFPGRFGGRTFAEIALQEPNGLVGGYRQSKWVADRLVTIASERGLPVCIYRPGQITGAQTTGVCSTDTYLNAAIKSCIQLNAELEFDVMLEISPVDFCAKSIVHIALSANRHGQYFHLCGVHPVSWKEVINMIRVYGYDLRPLAYKDWYQELNATLESGQDNALRKFFPLFGEDNPSMDAGDEGSRPFFKSECLQEALRGSGIKCHVLDQNLMSLYLDYFVSVGFLPQARKNS